MMTFNDYNREKVMERLEKQLDYHETMLEAWSKVTRNYKKNGEPFADLAKNFSGLNVYNARYTLQTNVKELSITAMSNKNGYITEYIENTELVKYTKLNPTPDRIIKESYLEEYFYLTPDELTDKIKTKIEYHAGRIEALKKAIRENKKDNKVMEKLLDTITKELAKVNPDAASYYKEELIHKYY